jgi:hypothetical protein
LKYKLGNFLDGNDDAFLHEEFPNGLPRIGIDGADYGGGVILEGVDPWQIIGEVEINPPTGEAHDDEKERQGSQKNSDESSSPLPFRVRSHIYNVREKIFHVNI